MRVLVVLSGLPLLVFGLLTGLTVWAAGRRRETLKTKAEFDPAFEPAFVEAKRTYRFAWLGTAVSQCLLLGFLFWVLP